MTVENALKLLEKYKDRMENPDGKTQAERDSVKEASTKAYENMKQHIETGKKFKGVKIPEGKSGKKSKG